MPRANRYFIPGQIWHITHRCHEREFLLKFAKDRRRWIHWLFEAKKRYDLRVLNYALTSNHIHMLVMDSGDPKIIPSSMDLISGRTAQEYNLRKGRSGAFWQDRYHATAVESGIHLLNCMVYIDLNMVRAGVVRHPREWPHCGYREIVGARQRYNLIHWASLLMALGMKTREDFKRDYAEWVERASRGPGLARDSKWTESIAVGGKEFIGKVKEDLGIKAIGRRIEEVIGENGHHGWILREDRKAYSHAFPYKNEGLRPKI